MEYKSEPLLNPTNKYQKAYSQFKEEFTSRSHGINFDDCDEGEVMDLEAFESENFSAIGHIFKKECERLNKSNTYFYGCSFVNYLNNYEKRLNDFIEHYTDVNEYNFIETELKLDIHYFTTEVNKRQINYSIQKRNEYLNDKKAQLTTNTQQIEIESESTLIIDLSNSSAVQKIIYLNELGLIELLHKEPCFKASVNNLASVLSAITGENINTLQPILNPMLNTNTAQKNNPYSSKSTVKKVKSQLINLGLNSK